MRKFFQVTTIGLLVIATRVFGDAEGLPQFPPNSYQIQDYTVPGSDTVQPSFRMDSKYPESGIIDYYSAGVSEHWLACRSASPGWELYLRDVDGQEKVVHQLIRYWVNEEDKKMLSIIVRHHSNGGVERCVPEGDVQDAVVVVSVSRELKKEMRLLKLKCGGNVARWEAALPASCSFD